jgi:hypothetical protein
VTKQVALAVMRQEAKIIQSCNEVCLHVMRTMWSTHDSWPVLASVQILSIA